MKRGRKNPLGTWSFVLFRMIQEHRTIRFPSWFTKDDSLCYLGLLTEQEYRQQEEADIGKVFYIFNTPLAPGVFWVSYISNHERRIEYNFIGVDFAKRCYNTSLHWSEALIYREAFSKATREVLDCIFICCFRLLGGRDVARIICRKCFELRKTWFDEVFLKQ